MSAPTLDFDALTDSLATPAPEGGVRQPLQLPEGWMQGRAGFGGIVAAAGLRAITKALDDPERLPRALTVHFTGPVGPEPAEITASVVRAGRAMTFAEARVEQGGKTRTLVQGSFGALRTSSAALPPSTRPETPSPDTLIDLPMMPGITPVFVQHFGLRWAGGHPPFSGADEAFIQGWCQHRTSARRCPEAVLGLLDAWPSPALSMMAAPAPASTVSWMVQFEPLPAETPEGWWWFESRARSVADGYATFSGALYLPDGRLAAHHEQLVALFG